MGDSNEVGFWVIFYTEFKENNGVYCCGFSSSWFERWTGCNCECKMVSGYIRTLVLELLRNTCSRIADYGFILGKPRENCKFHEDFLEY